MRFEVLGPVRIRQGSETIRIGSGRQRSVLALLLASAGRTVAADSMIEAVWGDDLPGDPQNTLQHAIAQLRKVIEPGRSRGQPAKVLVSQGDGYRLDLTDHELDSNEFVRLLDEATGLLERGTAVDALETIERGLGLWRGDAYSDLAETDLIRRERERLDGLKISARVLAADALSAVQGPESAIPPFEALTSEYPLREGLWAKLMTALYRSGRQAEALRVYGEVAGILGEELGLVPSQELRDLEESILLQDPSLGGPSARLRNASVPAPTHRLIGREVEIAALSEALSEARLVTLVGPGGSGKTRLAIEATTILDTTHPDAVWFVRLDELEDESLLGAKIGAVVGMPEDPDRKVEDTLARFIGLRSAALVLDNCEHLVNAVSALVPQLLERCPKLTVVTTSQQALNVKAEQRFPVPPLALPGEGDVSPFDDLKAVDSVRLFIDRAQAVDPDLDMSDESLRAIANIVAALDGMPLAIELAAARSDLFTPAELAMRLGDRFTLLSDGPRDVPDRQRDLRSVFEWSFGLLDENGQRCLSELSVFVGTFGPAAAAAVLDEPTESVHRILGHFVQRSLLQRDRSEAGTTRFRMLESLRHFASECLAAVGESAPARERHAEFYSARVAVLDEELVRHGQAEAFSEMVVESENVRSALAWALGSGRLDIGVPLAARCGRFWDWRGSVSEALTWFRRLDDAAAPADTPQLGLALSWYGYFVMESGQIERARIINQRAREVAVHSDDSLSEAAAATVGAVIARYDGKLSLALELDAAARARAEHLQDSWLGAWAVNHDALCHLAGGDIEAAAAAAEASLSGFVQLGDQRGVGWAMTVQATVALQAGDLDRAAELSSGAADISRRVGDGRNAAWALEIGAAAAETDGDRPRAEALRGEARELLSERGVPFSPWRR